MFARVRLEEQIIALLQQGGVTLDTRVPLSISDFGKLRINNYLFRVTKI